MISLYYIRRYLQDIRWENLPVCGLDKFLQWNIEVKRRSSYDREPGVIAGKKEWIIAYIAQLMCSEEAKGIQGGVYGKPPEGPVEPESACADIRAEIPGGLLVGYRIARVNTDYFVAFGNHIRSDMFGEVCAGCNGYGVFQCNVCDGSRKQIVTCVSCQGTGKVMCNCDKGTTICSSCAGRGKIPRFMGFFARVCASCSGSGRVQCKLCKGRGFNYCSRCSFPNSGQNEIPCSACAATAGLKCARCEGGRWSVLHGATDKGIEYRLDWFRHAMDPSASPSLTANSKV
jgi:hypothetical protein